MSANKERQLNFLPMAYNFGRKGQENMKGKTQYLYFVVKCDKPFVKIIKVYSRC